LRKTSCGPCGAIPWGADDRLHDNSLNEDVDKAREGRVPDEPVTCRKEQEASEGAKPKGAFSGGAWPNPRSLAGIPGGVLSPGEGRSGPCGAGANFMREAAFERTYGAAWGSKAPKGEPHERDWDETSPAGCGGSKASRGCETLRAQPNRMRWDSPGYVAPHSWENAVGDKTSEGAGVSRVFDGSHRGRRNSRCCVGDTLKGSQSL
jgi:hypothetical protein